MPIRRPSPDHQEAVSRRLALLSAELAGERATMPPAEPPAEDWTTGHTRIRPAGRPGPPGPPEPRGQEAPVVPVPGRHASRRPADRALASMRGRVVLGPAQVAVLAVGVAVALAATCWWLVRGDPAQVRAPAPVLASAASGSPLAALPSPSSPSSPVSAPAGAAGAPPEGSVTVDVAGRVRRPGIVVLDAGARVVDALEAAGGARPGVDLLGLNLARPLVDGEQVVVGQAPPAGSAAAAAPTAAPPSGATPVPMVDLNTATATELEALPQVGPVTAAAIVAWREEHGGFTAVEELLEVDGIGDATLAQISPYATV